MFCSNCGKEVDEKAYVCPNCGVLVVREAAKVPAKATETVEKSGTAHKVFLLISFTLMCLTTILFWWGIVEKGAWSFHISEDFFPFIWTFSFGGLGCGIASFAMGFKARNEALKFFSVINFIAVNATFIIAILFTAYMY